MALGWTVSRRNTPSNCMVLPSEVFITNFVRFSLIVLVFLVSACGGTRTKDFVWKDPVYDLAWPKASEKDRIIYLRSISGPKDFKKDETSQKAWRWLFGENETEFPLLGPFAVAASENIIWVADSGARMLFRIDLSKGKFEYFRQISDHLLTLPSGVALDLSQNRVFMSDAAADFVFVLDNQGNLIEKWSVPGGIKRPTGLTFSPGGELFVCDAIDGKVYVFNTKGEVKG